MKIFDLISVVAFLGTISMIFLLLIVALIREFGFTSFTLSVIGLLIFFAFLGILGNGIGVIINKLNEKYDEKHGLSEK